MVSKRRRSKNRAGKKGGRAKGSPVRSVFNEETKFDVPNNCKSDDPAINILNDALVKYYGCIAACRKDVHALLEEQKKGERKVGLDKALERLDGMVKRAREMREQIGDRDGRAAPLPTHFNSSVKL